MSSMTPQEIVHELDNKLFVAVKANFGLRDKVKVGRTGRSHNDQKGLLRRRLTLAYGTKLRSEGPAGATSTSRGDLCPA